VRIGAFPSTFSHIQFSVDKYVCVFFNMYDVVLCFQTNTYDNCCIFQKYRFFFDKYMCFFFTYMWSYIYVVLCLETSVYDIVSHLSKVQILF